LAGILINFARFLSFYEYNPHMKKATSFVNGSIILLLLILFYSCSSNKPMDLNAESIIPKPIMVSATGSSFELTASASIMTEADNPGMKEVANQLAFLLRPATGFELPVVEDISEGGKGNIHLLHVHDKELGNEGYEIEITKGFVRLGANTNEGLFRAVQTLRQLFPADIEKKELQQGPWLVATGTIRDYPEYAYRGAMLDVSRHFFGPDMVKKYIDLLAAYKINQLHLHLSDDQGWRIEVKSWPKLTGIGSSTEVGGGEGGFYTQEEYKDIVRYAADRYITIIPEIDMPGHTNAALASYAELNCDGKQKDLYTGTEVGFSTLCTDSEITYKFVDDVVRELSELTPGPYIHIGGDESHVTKKDDYIYFVDRVQQIVQQHGKVMIGWEEVAQADLSSSSIAQHWANTEYPLMAKAKGAKILMSPAKKAYLDMKYDSTTTLGLSWAGYIEVDSAYLWDPSKMVKGLTREDILGIEAPLWTETITNLDELTFMVFPRLPGYAEIGWTAADRRDWQDYKKRLAVHGKRMEAMGIHFYRSSLVNW
jgi:hexosaminidase